MYCYKRESQQPVNSLSNPSHLFPYLLFHILISKALFQKILCNFEQVSQTAVEICGPIFADRLVTLKSHAYIVKGKQKKAAVLS